MRLERRAAAWGEALDAWLRLAAAPKVLRRAALYAVVVGAVLVVINHGDALLRVSWMDRAC